MGLPEESSQEHGSFHESRGSPGTAPFLKGSPRQVCVLAIEKMIKENEASHGYTHTSYIGYITRGSLSRSLYSFIQPFSPSDNFQIAFNVMWTLASKVVYVCEM